MEVRLNVEEIAVEYSPLFSLDYEIRHEVESFILHPLGKTLPDETILGIGDNFATLLDYINEEIGDDAVLPKRYIEAYNLVKKAKHSLSYSEAEDLITSFVEGKEVDKEKLRLALIKVFRFEEEKHYPTCAYLLTLIYEGEKKGRNIFDETGLSLKISPANTLYILSRKGKDRGIKSSAQLYPLLKYTNWEWYGKECAPTLAIMIFKEIEKKFTSLSLIKKKEFLELWKDIIERLETNNPFYFEKLKINLRHGLHYPYLFLFALSLFSKDEEMRKNASDCLLRIVEKKLPYAGKREEKVFKEICNVIKRKKKHKAEKVSL